MHSMNAQPPNTGKLINCLDIPKDQLPANTVFIDKGSFWENPFTVVNHENRMAIQNRYALLLAHSPEMLEEIDFLKGKDLASFDAPHGEILLALAAMTYRQRLEWAEQIKAKNTKDDQLLLAA